MTVVISGDTGISPVTASGTSASVDGMTVGRGGGEVSNNTTVGSGAMAATATGGDSVAVGYQALAAMTSGSSNVGIGSVALTANDTGANNVGVGVSSLRANTSGGSNTALGVQSLRFNTTASNNTAVGYQAGYSSTTGDQNVYLGVQAGYTGTTGTHNLMVGFQAGYSSTGSYNTFVGCRNASDIACGQAMTTGTRNTILGGYSGNQSFLDMRTLSNHVVLSDGDGNMRGWFNSSGQLFVNTGNVLSQTGIANFVGSANAIITQVGNGSSGFQSTNTSGTGTYYGAIFGNNGNSFSTCGYIQVSGTTCSYVTSSDYRLKENIAPMTGALAKVAQLKPVTYKWKSDGTDGEGFIAHELAEVCPNAVTGEKDAVKEDNSIMPQGIDTSFLVATLTAAIQELKAEFDAYKSTHP